MGGKVIDIRSHEKQIKSTLFAFYESFYGGDRLKLYSYLDTSFQKEVPLNYFLVHSDYDKDLGRLLKITRIEVQKEKNIVFVEGIVEVDSNKKNFSITLRSDFGGLKIEGESIFRRNFTF